MIILALILNTAGFLLLAIADPRHCEVLIGRWPRLPRTTLVNVSAAALIATSLIVLLPLTGLGEALVAFFGLSTIGSALTAIGIVLRRPSKTAR